MNYYCGWDGGGSKTRVCTVNTQGDIQAEASFGPLNFNGASSEAVYATVRDCLSFMSRQPGGLGACSGLVIGMAGISNSRAAEMLEFAIRQNGYSGKLRILGDQEITLAGAIEGPGAILIAGTGSICFGRDAAGRPFRCGGYGYLIDDEGSGYALGRDILKAVIRAADGRGSSTCLTAGLYQQLHVSSPSGLVTWLYAPEIGKKQVAALAPLLIPALSQGDAAAQAIAQNAARELADMLIAAWKKAGLATGEVVLMGSIFTYFDSIRLQTISLLHEELPEAQIRSPRHEPSYGAAELARSFFS